MKNRKLKGSILIFLGAACYGMLGIYVKMAYQAGYTTAEVTLSQFIIGAFALLLLTALKRPNNSIENSKIPIKSKLHLMIAGTSLGLTSICYYLAVSYIPVSVCIVLLMQMVWLGVVLEIVLTKKIPERRSVLAAILVIGGSILATKVFEQSISLDWKGIVFGLLSAVCYTATIYSTKNIQPEYAASKRSLYMVLGGLIVIILVFSRSINLDFDLAIFGSWGLVIALFGTFLPPLLFTAGMPLTGISLGAILSSVEIPVAVFASMIVLGEKVSVTQWIGVALVLFAVLMMNIKREKME